MANRFILQSMCQATVLDDIERDLKCVMHTIHICEITLRGLLSMGRIR
jgi:hypothetical protein